ncbi:unnamed protein product, partial [Allacma fusca]
ANGKVIKAEWKTFVEKQFPESVREKLIPEVVRCSKSYVPYQQNKRCDENDEFYRCYIDAVDSVCD